MVESKSKIEELNSVIEKVKKVEKPQEPLKSITTNIEREIQVETPVSVKEKLKDPVDYEEESDLVMATNSPSMINVIIGIITKIAA